MPTLADVLQGRDLAFLKMVAGTWGLELAAPDAAAALPLLVQGILSHQWRAEVLETLPDEARTALKDLLADEGRMPWARFTRRFGELRALGPARRDRERPDLRPASTTEALYYRGLIGRNFLKISGVEDQEYAYIPDDLLEIAGGQAAPAEQPPGRPATPGECAAPRPASSAVLDQAATLLAWLRLGEPVDTAPDSGWTLPAALLLELLKAARLADDDGQPFAEGVRAFLEAPRGAALSTLASGWAGALYLNELRLLPGLKCEGEWLNDPLRARQAVLRWVGMVPQGIWWNLNSFLRAIRERDPDFQRPAGDYDSWFIRKELTRKFLRGFETWDEVDGALVRFLLLGPLHALGYIDLAAPAPGGEPAAFRLSAWYADLLEGRPPDGLPVEDRPLLVNREGEITVPPLAPRAARYQLARFCEWQGERDGAFLYRITSAGLERAARQGLKPRMLVTLLQRHTAEGQMPPNLVKALERWEASGTQVTLANVPLLRVTSAEILAALRKTRAARWIDQELSPTLVTLRPGGEEQVINALQEIGYLTGARTGGKP